MSGMKNYRELDAWQLAMTLVETTYALTRLFPETQVELARRLNYVTAERTRELDEQLDRVRQMLYGMQREHLRRLGEAGATIVSVFLLLLAAGVFS